VSVFTPFGAPLALVAATPLAGVALQNGTPTFLTWQVPNDGQNHTVFGVATWHATVAGTGGRVNVAGLAPDGSALATQIQAAGQAVGTGQGGVNLIVAPNQQITVVQSTALTAGAVQSWFELWAA
jgi:hypothetical protein